LLRSIISDLTSNGPVWSGFMRTSRVQWHTYITHFSEHAMQRGLIDH